jgi:hypothetical protein
VEVVGDARLWSQACARAGGTRLMVRDPEGTSLPPSPRSKSYPVLRTRGDIHENLESQRAN